jgi:hypothetical protein
MDLRELLDQRLGLHEEQTGCQVEDGLGQDSFVQNRKTYIDHEGVPVTVGIARLHRLECGHIVGAQGSAELLGRCGKCGGWLCFRCEARCAGCDEVLCPKCKDELDSVIFCKKCKRKARIKGFLSLMFGKVHDGLSR